MLCRMIYFQDMSLRMPLIAPYKAAAKSIYGNQSAMLTPARHSENNLPE